VKQNVLFAEGGVIVKSAADKGGSAREVLERVRARMPHYFNDPGVLKTLTVIHSAHRTLSDIHYLLGEFEGGARRKLILKISDSAEAQFLAMKAIWPSFEVHDRWKIPRPLDYFAEHSALLMEQVTGNPFMDLLPRVIWRERQITSTESDCERIGQWLRYYHDIRKAENPAPLNAEGTWPGLDATLHELREAGFQNSIYPKLQMFIVPLMRPAVTNARPVARVHGDFTIDNVMLSQDQVIVVDVCAGFRNAIDLDIASFLNSLIWLRLTRIVPWSAIARMRNAFLSGYFQNDPVEPLTMTFLQGMGFADVALEIVKRRPSKMVHFWVERNVMAALEIIIAQLRRLQ
jgi:hypothetical protein